MITDSYIAGFFDGEGCISSTSQYIKGKYEMFPRVSIQITITQKDKYILELVQNIYGGEISEKGSGCHVLRIVGKGNMKRFLTAIYPYSICKKEQIELALSFIETIREENLGCKPLPVCIHEQRGDIHNKLKELKIVS